MLVLRNAADPPAANRASSMPGTVPSSTSATSTKHRREPKHYNRPAIQPGTTSRYGAGPRHGLPNRPTFTPHNGGSLFRRFDSHTPHGNPRNRGTWATATPSESQVGLLIVTGLPNNVNGRMFRKTIGHALAATFSDPPRFKTFLRSRKGIVEFGTLLLPNSRTCDIFLNRFGRGGGYHHGKKNASRPVVEIKKHRLEFKRGDLGQHHVSQQDAQSLHYDPPGVAVRDADSDYEADEVEAPEVSISYAELGAWDEQGNFARAWRSVNVERDQYSCLELDADQGELTARIDDRIIVLSLYRLDNIVVHHKDVYFGSTVLPSYLRDESEGYHLLKKQVGMMDLAQAESIKYVRTASLDEEHAQTAAFCYVLHVRSVEAEPLEAFIQHWKRRLLDLVDYRRVHHSADDYFGQVQRLEELYKSITFQLSFQVQAVVHQGLLLPLEVLRMGKVIETLDKSVHIMRSVEIFKNAVQKLRHRAPAVPTAFTVDDFVAHLLSALDQMQPCDSRASTGTTQPSPTGPPFLIHQATITPSGLWLDGPHVDEGNRIIRRYADKSDYFMRVRVAEETGQVIRDNRDVDIEAEIYSGRVRSALQSGLVLGGRLFRFLAWSTSSLREHSVWFVADFVDDATLQRVSAHSIRDGIGDLHHIRVPARYAARMGQAFTTTAFSIPIDYRKVIMQDDYKTKDGKGVFSDGCGQISSDVVARLQDTDNRRRRRKIKLVQPTVYQIRMGGAKGVLALNTDLQSHDVVLRPSMKKFEVATDSGEIALEVASSADNPLPTNLNRPLIALLETLGVPAGNFVKIQDRAVATLTSAVTDTQAALKLYRTNAHFGEAPNMPDLLQTLHRVLDVQGITQVPFLKRCNLTCLTALLRQIKYKAKSRVENAWTLMGVVDETGWLQEGQVFVQLRESTEDGIVMTEFLRGRCLVGRSPYLAPGDIQYATLVGEAPRGSPLNSLYNCVVFSHKGKRPLPSQLAGGDLDGDLYNVFQNLLLYPTRTEYPCGYAPVEEHSLSHPVTITEVIDFFLTFLQSDRLGMIADRHLNISDRSERGVCDRDCIKLAELASIAVDFMKTGVAPDLHRIPRLPDNAKADYFQSEHRLESAGDASRPLSTMESRTRWGRERATYYKSEKALGQLFRRIDVNNDIDAWGRKAPATLTERIVRRKIWTKLEKWLPEKWDDASWDHELAQVQSFYNRLQSIAEEYAPERRRLVLSESEIFMGVILGRYGTKYGASSRGYNAQISLRDDFQRAIDETMNDYCGQTGIEGADERWDMTVIDAASLRQALAGGGDGDVIIISDSESNNSDDAELRSLPTSTERRTLPAPLQRLYEEATTMLVALARWVRAAEIFQDAHSEHRSASRVSEYESAKWIVIGPLLRKFEELQLWEAFCVDKGFLELEGDVDMDSVNDGRVGVIEHASDKKPIATVPREAVETEWPAQTPDLIDCSDIDVGLSQELLQQLTADLKKSALQ